MFIDKNLFCLYLEATSSRLNKSINDLFELKNHHSIINLDLKFDFLREYNYTNNFENEGIIFFRLTYSALTNKFFLDSSKKNFLNKKTQNKFNYIGINSDLINEKLNQGKIKKVNFFASILIFLKNLFRFKSNTIYYNLLDLAKNSRDLSGNKLKKFGFNKIINTKIFFNDFTKIYADKLKKNSIKILSNSSNSCPEIDNFQSAFLVLYKYFLREKNNFLNSNKSKIIKMELKKLKRFNSNEFKKFQKNFIKQFNINRKNTSSNNKKILTLSNNFIQDNFLEFKDDDFKLKSLEELNLLVFIDFLNDEQSDRNYIFSDQMFLKFRALRLIVKNKKNAIRDKKSKKLKKKISDSKGLLIVNDLSENFRKNNKPVISNINGITPNPIVEPSNRPTKLINTGGKANNFDSKLNLIIDDLKPNNPILIAKSEEAVVSMVIDQLNNIQNKLKSRYVNFNSIDEVVDFTKNKLLNIANSTENKVVNDDYKFEKISNQNVINDNFDKSLNKNILGNNSVKNEVPSPSPRLIHVKVSFNANDLKSLTNTLFENVGKWQKQVKSHKNLLPEKFIANDRSICL